MHDFNMFRALCSDSISVRFAAWHRFMTLLTLYAAFISPMVSSIPPSIGIKYSAMNIQRILLQSNIVNEQIVVPPSSRSPTLARSRRWSRYSNRA